MSQIGEEIKKLLEEHQSLKKSEARLAEIVPEIEKVNREVQTLEQQMRKEFEDIENLEKLGMKALFYKVLGSQEEQLEKERQEYGTGDPADSPEDIHTEGADGCPDAGHC